MEIIAIEADITRLNVDAIVNAANNQLNGGAGVDGAIHLAAGPDLLKYTNANYKGCATGDAAISPGFNLPCKYIIHTVGPVWHGGSHSEAKLLATCYQNCLNVASKTKDIRSIAFPAISTGIFGYPEKSAAEIAITTIYKNIKKVDIDKVIFACYSTKMLSIYNKLL